ncbi:O-antigen ligase family protein [Paenibacillus macerans]|uniref:O-antigen ligase family protein n=1 Tax=Paenibacillus macerans TaxID=44252 RepID=UPI0020403CBF|nr:O-antigen ligase family protein [Paenibacillus macerans]MCM3702906.1 O-antigen ligase family protein [Paenibacillus macerans]
MSRFGLYGPAVAVCGTGLVLCGLNGLFFMDTAAALLLVSGWLAVSAAVAGAWALRWKKAERHRLFFERQWDGWLLAGPFVLAVLYGLTLLAANALSVQATFEGMLSWAFYGVVGVAVYLAAGEKGSRHLLETGWLAIGGLLAVTGLAAVYGLLPLPGAVLRTADREIAAAGARLGGLLQYPNTYGAVMAAFLLERLVRLAGWSAADFSRERRWRGYGAAAWALLYALCLLVSESRGAYAAGLAGWAAGCALLRGPARRRYVLHSGVIAAAGAVLARQLAAAQLAPAPLPGLLALAAVLASALLLAGRAARWREARSPASVGAAGRSPGAGPRRSGAGGLGAATRGQRRRTPPWRTLLRALRGRPGARAPQAQPPPRAAALYRAAACGGAALLLAAPLAELASAGFPGRLFRPETWFARAAMYGDAVQLLRQSPWLGQGGDAWRQAFRSVQSHPYVGNEVHSGYLDIALDLGLLGLAIMLLWLGAAAVRLFRARSPLLPPFAVLLLHSTIDFDMSYGIVWLLIIGMIGMTGAEDAAQTKSREEHITVKQTDASGRNRTLEVHANVPRNKRRADMARNARTANNLPRFIRPVFGVLLSVLLLAVSAAGFLQAESLRLYRSALSLQETASLISSAAPMHSQTAANAQNSAGLFGTPVSVAVSSAGDANAAQNHQAALLERSLAYWPYRTSARLALAGLSAPPEAAAILRSGLAYDAANPALWLALGGALACQTDLGAAPAMNRALELDRFDPHTQTAALRGLEQLARRLSEQGRPRQAKAAAAAGARIFARYAKLADSVKSSVRRNDRRFRLTAEAVILGEAMRQMADSAASSQARLN